MATPSRSQVGAAVGPFTLLAGVFSAYEAGWIRVASPVFDPDDYPEGATLQLEAALETTNTSYNAQLRLMDGATQMALIQTVADVPTLVTGAISNLPTVKQLISLELKLESGAPAEDAATVACARILLI